MRCESFHTSKNLVHYEIYPSVIVNILSHHQRRPENDERVIGVLLGTYKESKVTISDSFAVQTKIKNEEIVSFEEEMFGTLLKLKKQVNPNEIMVGWYSTLTRKITINYISALLDRVFSQQSKERGNPAPVYVTVHTDLENERLQVRAWRGKLFNFPLLEPDVEGITQDDLDAGDDVVHKFVQVPLKLIASDAEKIALDVILKSPVDKTAEDPSEVPFDSPSTIESDMDQMVNNLVNMMCDFQDVHSQVKKILSEEVKSDPELAWQITSALANSPNLQDSVLDKQTGERVNDLLMVKLLVVMTKAQVAISKHLPGAR